jgi:hypothetical protein
VFPVFTSVDADEANAVASVITADTTNGRVGIGTATPAAELDVAAAVAPVIQLTSEKNGTWVADDPFGEINFYGKDTSSGGPGYRSRILSVAQDTFGYEGELAFHTTNASTGDTEVVRIDSSGNVGIGTASPAHPLHVTGSDNRPIRAESSVSGSYIDIQDSATTAEGYVAIGAVGDEARIIAGGSTRMTIDSSGNVGINDTSPSYKLDVTGDINATGDFKLGGTSLGRGVLAFNETASDFTLTTSLLDILNVTFTLPSTRIVMLAASVPLYDNYGGTPTNAANLFQNTNAAGSPTTYYGTAYAILAGTTQGQMTTYNVTTLTAGTYTIYWVASTNTGTARMNGQAGSDLRHQFTAIDLGAP